MAENMGKWPSGHGQLTNIRLADGCGGKTITTAAQFEYVRHGFEGSPGNIGQEVRDAGEKLGIVLHGHVVVTKSGHSSFKALGFLLTGRWPDGDEVGTAG